jgi:ribulose-phosphate 3-epimerase
VTRAVRIAPSILSADFAHLGDQVRTAEAAGADMIHVDVMDGRFVPPITIGPLVVKSLRKVTSLPLDVHLMIVEPERQIDAFAAAGADTITVHVETCPHLHRTVQQIKKVGARAGVTLNPGTSIEALRGVLPEVDQVLVMSVNPGWGGQQFIPAALERLKTVRVMLDALGSEAALEIDGGIHEKTAPAAVAAGADLLVAGSAIFNDRESVGEAVARLRASVEGAVQA